MSDQVETSPHYFSLSGDELREFKNCVESFYSVEIGKHTASLVLWTERGCARHAKSLNSDRAWDMFELLEETSFAVVKEQKPVQPSRPSRYLPPYLQELKRLHASHLVGLQGRERQLMYNALRFRLYRRFGTASIYKIQPDQVAEAMEVLTPQVMPGNNGLIHQTAKAPRPAPEDTVTAVPDFDMEKLPKGFEQLLETAEKAQDLLRHIEAGINLACPCVYNPNIGNDKRTIVENAKDLVQIARGTLKSCEYALRSFARLRTRVNFLTSEPLKLA